VWESSILFWFHLNTQVRETESTFQLFLRNHSLTSYFPRDTLTAAYFTERLPHGSEDLQWSLFLPNGIKRLHPSRGNRPYASQDLKPEWLDKEGFLDFASVCQFPQLALRKMCVATKHESLPLHHNAVHALLRQTLYHVGDLVINNEEVHLQWRRDFEDIHKTCSYLLKFLTDTYAEKPYFYKACAILGEMAGYFASLSANGHSQLEVASFQDVAKRLAKSAMGWAQSYDDEVQKVSLEFVTSLLSKQVICFRAAVLCLVHQNDITRVEASILLKCIVRATNSFVEDDDDTEERDELKGLCDYFLSNRQS